MTKRRELGHRIIWEIFFSIYVEPQNWRKGEVYIRRKLNETLFLNLSWFCMTPNICCMVVPVPWWYYSAVSLVWWMLHHQTGHWYPVITFLTFQTVCNITLHTSTHCIHTHAAAGVGSPSHHLHFLCEVRVDLIACIYAGLTPPLID